MIRILIFVGYQLLLVCALPFVIINIVMRHLFGKPVAGSWSNRVGFLPKTHGDHVIWFHAVSVGETFLLESLISKTRNVFPGTTCYVTSGTLAGHTTAKKHLGADYTSFIPFDFLLPMLLAFCRIRPRALVIAEAEIWPNLLLVAYWKKIPTYLINARVSKRSEKRYHLFKFLLTPLLTTFQKLYVQAPSDYKHYLKLGVPAEKLSHLGNIKAYNVVQKHKAALAISPPFTITQKRAPRLLIGSVHEGEIDVYLDALAHLRTHGVAAQAIIAPRHFHWKETLVQKVTERGWSYTMWDEKSVGYAWNMSKHDVLLVCTIGLLFNLYRESNLFFLGGTFAPIGGHNLLEPAVWSCPSIVGPHYFNTQNIADELATCGAITLVKSREALKATTLDLVTHPKALDAMANASKTWLDKHAREVEKNLADLFSKLRSIL